MAFFKHVILCILAMAFFINCSGKPPLERGVKDGRLLPCPHTPNCVSSMEKQSEKSVKPLVYQTNRNDARMVMRQILVELGNTTIKEESDDYIWVECRSKLLGFVDDLEVYFPEDEKVVHIRSASRLGYYDFGVNKKRVVDIYERIVKKEGFSLQP